MTTARHDPIDNRLRYRYIAKNQTSSQEGRRPGDAGRQGASAVPAGEASSALLPGGPGIMPTGTMTGARGASLEVGAKAGGHIRRVGQAATKPGPDRTKGQQHPLGRAAVERRQASAPDSGKGGASRLLRGAPCAPLAYRLRKPRLPALRFLHLSFFVARVEPTGPREARGPMTGSAKPGGGIKASRSYPDYAPLHPDYDLTFVIASQ